MVRERVIATTSATAQVPVSQANTSLFPYYVMINNVEEKNIFCTVNIP